MGKTTKELLADFLAQRYKNFDTPSDPFNPLKEAFVDLDLPDADLYLHSPTGPKPPVKIDDLSLSPPPANPIKIGDFTRITIAATQPSLPFPQMPGPAGPIDIGNLSPTQIAALQPSLPTPLSPGPAGPINPGNFSNTQPANLQPSLPFPQMSAPADGIAGDVPPATRITPIQSGQVPNPSIGPREAINTGDFPKSKPPADPADVRLKVKPHGLASEQPTVLAIEQKNSQGLSLQQIDKALFTYLKHVGDGSTMSIATQFGNPEGDPYAPAVGNAFGMAGGQAWNPILFAKNVVRLGVHLKLGLITFGAIQLGLTLLNPVMQNGPRVQLWNPLVIANPPLLGSFIYGTINSTLRFTHQKDVVEDGNDRHKQIAQGKYDIPFQPINNIPPVTFQNGIGSVQNPVGAIMSFFFPRLVGAASQDKSILEASTSPTDIGQPLIDTALKKRNFYTPDTNNKGFETQAIYTIADLVEEVLTKNKNILIEDAAISNNSDKRLRFPSFKDDVNAGPNAKLLKLFNINFIGNSTYPTEWRPSLDPSITRKSIGNNDLEKAAFPKGIIPVKFKNDNPQGFVTVPKGKNPSDLVKDDEAYVPLSFHDLRPIRGSQTRAVFFRPFITDFKETFHPDWNKAHYFGRTDWVATYQSTGRSISLAFQIHAFGPEDLDGIYNKLNWLTSMVYPTYDVNLSYVAGPVVRLRIGDVISSELGKGLPGIIESLDYDYSGALWELRDKTKVVRSVKVSLNFVVLHDMPIGLGGGGKFGGMGTIDPGTGLWKQNDADAVNAEPGAQVKFPEIKAKNSLGFRAFPSNFNDYTTSGTPSADTPPASDSTTNGNANNAGSI